MSPPPPSPHIRSKMKCKNRSGEGGHLSHYPTSIQHSLTIPRFLQKRLNLREGRIPRAEISLGAFRAFCFCLFAFADAHSKCAWSAPQHHRPQRAGAHTPPHQPGRRAANPGSANLRISPRRARQTTWRAPHAPAPPLPSALPPYPKPTVVFQRRCPRRPQIQERPLSTPGASQVAHSSRTPSALRGTENTPRLGQPGPKLSRGEKVKREEGGHKRIFFPS